MMLEPVFVTPTRTVRLRIAPAANKRKTLALQSTQEEWALPTGPHRLRAQSEFRKAEVRAPRDAPHYDG